MPFFIMIGVFAFALLSLAWGYNTLATLRQRCRQAFGDIDVQLRQRHDLVPNLMRSVKAYMGHERDTFEAVIEARNAAMDARSPAQRVAAENALSDAVSRIFALAEGYPELKASATFLDLQEQLGNLEDKIAAARRFFNSSAAEYNAARESLPGVFIAGALGFEQQPFFELSASERVSATAPPQVKF